MDNIIQYDLFLEKLSFSFSEEQIKESVKILTGENNEAILEAWYNTILDLAALIPGIGSFAEGINLVSYAKQGEYLLAALCAIGLIPLFGQYVGAGGSLLVKALRSGGKLGEGILKPLAKLIARFFPNITKFLKSSAFIKKFPSITPYIDDMLKSLSNFAIKGGEEVNRLATSRALRRGIKKDVGRAKGFVKIADWLTPDKPKVTQTSIQPFTQYQIQQSVSPQADWTKYIEQ
jgi:hypothetical protein